MRMLKGSALPWRRRMFLSRESRYLCYGGILPDEHARPAVQKTLRSLYESPDRPDAVFCGSIPDAELVYLTAQSDGLENSGGIIATLFQRNLEERRVGRTNGCAWWLTNKESAPKPRRFFMKSAEGDVRSTTANGLYSTLSFWRERRCDCTTGERLDFNCD